MSHTSGLQRRQQRVRSRIRQRSVGRPRLTVFRSNKNIYAQVIDDEKRVTLAAASSVDKALQGKLKVGSNVGAAETVGQLLAERALKAGVKNVVFDRGGYLYHGRVKVLAEAARAKGLSF